MVDGKYAHTHPLSAVNNGNDFVKSLDLIKIENDEFMQNVSGLYTFDQDFLKFDTPLVILPVSDFLTVKVKISTGDSGFAELRAGIGENKYARGRITSDELRYSYDDDIDEAQSTGIAGQPTLFSQLKKVKRNPIEDAPMWGVKNGKVTKNGSLIGNSTITTIREEEAGMAQVQKYIKSEQYEKLRDLIFGFVPDTLDTLKDRLKHRNWTLQLEEYVAAYQQTIQIIVFDFVHSNLPILWNSDYHVPNVSDPNFERLMIENDVQLHDGCIPSTCEILYGKFDGTEYVLCLSVI